MLDRNEWRCHMQGMLMPLTDAFNASDEAIKRRAYFEELVDNYEFEIALHALCDFLMDHAEYLVEERTIEQIGKLHREMQIVDDCTEKLGRKFLSI